VQVLINVFVTVSCIMQYLILPYLEIVKHIYKPVLVTLPNFAEYFSGILICFICMPITTVLIRAHYVRKMLFSHSVYFIAVTALENY
jgi:hypothetical protein